MKQSIVAVEDKRFYEHRGVDMRAIGRAFWADVQNQKVVQGGSTVTQQFIKNAYIKDQRSVARKLKEAALAWQLEQRWDKERILAAYLNTIYFGNGAYGIEQAARTYFDKRASQLTLPESALLAGIPPDPSGYDPVTHPRAAKVRRRLVLRQMLDQGLITDDDYDEARSAALPSPEKIKLPGTQGPAGHYFVNYVKQQLIDEYGPGRVFGGGLRVTTTIDLKLQKIAQQAIANTLKDPEGPQAALVAIHPQSGEILAMVGGTNFRESQFNLAVQGERQPGSAFKPFVLAAALRQGISPATQFESKKQVISLGDRLWVVNNYEGSYLGSIDLESATVHSDNAVYAQLTQLVGPPSVAAMARNAGIRSKLNPYFAIGLGAEAANPLEMARAFSTFANGGRRIDGSIFGDRPRAVRRVNSKVNEPLPRTVLSEDKTALLNSILQKVVTQGTGRRAALPDRPAAGKTGTTENYGDAWFVGYTPQLAVGGLGRLSEGPAADADRVPRRPCRRRHLPGRDLEDVHAGGSRFEGGRADDVPGAVDPLRLIAARRVPRRSHAGRQRQLPLGQARLLLQRRAAEADGELQGERGRGSAADRDARQQGARAAHLPAADPAVHLQARAGEAAARRRHRPDPGDRGRLSAYDEVKLVLPKPTHGVVPRLLGLKWETAKVKLERRKLQYEITEVDKGKPGRVVFQVPKAGVAARPGMLVKVAVVKTG